MRITAPVVLAALSALAMVAAGADEPLSYATAVRPIFEKECGDCHGPKRPKKGLNLLGSDAVAAMLERPSQNEPQVVLVKAGDPAASYLWRKLAHTHAEGKGMPRGLFTASKLPQEQIDLVARWIQQGARP
jgi:mono/diheme cytochrome c family protein